RPGPPADSARWVGASMTAGSVWILSCSVCSAPKRPKTFTAACGAGGVVAAAGVTLGRAGRNIRLDAFLTRLQDTTAEIRVRIAVALLIGFVALAAKMGLQTILGAFLAGVVLNLVDRDTASHPVFRSKLDALGYGFVIPVFFVSSGVEYDLSTLTRGPSALARIPLFLLSLLIVRGAPAVLYARP